MVGWMRHFSGIGRVSSFTTLNHPSTPTASGLPGHSTHGAHDTAYNVANVVDKADTYAGPSTSATGRALPPLLQGTYQVSAHKFGMVLPNPVLQTKQCRKVQAKRHPLMRTPNLPVLI